MKRTSGRSGFSLLEVMITLVIMAMAAAIVGPGLSAGLRSAASHAAVVQLDQQLLAVRREVTVTGDPQTLPAKDSSNVPGTHVAALSLPNGWTYETEQPITFHADGTCDEGVVTLVKQGASSIRFSIAMPSCRPAIIR